MSETGNGNGANGSERPNGVMRVTVTLDVHTNRLGIDMDCGTTEQALSMVDRARHEIDARFRFARAQEFAQAALQAKADADLAASIMGGARRQ